MRTKNKSRKFSERREYFEVHCTTLEKTELKFRAAELGQTISEYVLQSCFGPNGVCGAGGGRYDEELVRDLKALTVKAKKERKQEKKEAIAEKRKAIRQKKKIAKNRKIENKKTASKLTSR